MQRRAPFRAAALLACAAITLPVVARADEVLDLHASANVAMSAMNGNSARVRTMLRKARAERRVGQARCVDAALSRVDAALRSGREEDRYLEAALVRGDVPSARRSFGALLGYREATRVASLDADACITIVDVVPSDGTVVKIVVDPTLPSDRSL